VNRPLTKRQAEILDFIRSTLIDEQRTPTFREIGERFGITSPNGVVSHLKLLAKKGMIEMPNNQARSIKLLGVRVVLVDEAATGDEQKSGDDK
jgi:repressor LexA